jgi:hypothetical protein
MKYLRKSSIGQVCSFLAAMMLVMTSSPVPLFAQESASSDAVQNATKIKHEPIKYFVSGKRIRIAADVTDPEGVNVVRCYFKGKEQADFVFVPMTPGSSTYTAILPATAKNATSIEYLFLAVNNKNQVVKTQQFSVNIDASQPAPPWQDMAMEGPIKVSTELAQTPADLPGFSDSITMDVVESSLRFGFVAGLYSALQMAAAGWVAGGAATASSASGAATAVSAGTVTAGAGLSTAAIVGIAAGVVAVGVGVAVAAGSSSSSSSSTSCSNSNGTWIGSHSGNDCNNNPASGIMTMTCSNCSCYTDDYSYTYNDHTLGTCTVSGNSVSCSSSNTACVTHAPCTMTASGTFSGNTVSAMSNGANCGMPSETLTLTKQ